MMLISHRVDNQSSSTQKFLGQQPSSSLSGNVFSAFCFLCAKHFQTLPLPSTWEVMKLGDNSWFMTLKIPRNVNLHAPVYAKLIWMCERTKQNTASDDVKMRPEQRLKIQQPRGGFVMATGAFDIGARRVRALFGKIFAPGRTWNFLPG